MLKRFCAVCLMLAASGPATAGPIQESASRAASQTVQAPSSAKARATNKPMLWSGVGLLGGGVTLAVLSTTALKKEEAGCIGAGFSFVCGATSETNKAALWAGVAAAGTGALLAVIGATRAPAVTIAPGTIAVHKTIVLRQ